MKRVYIPIIVLLLAAFVFSFAQWQFTNWDLAASQGRVKSLLWEVEFLEEDIALKKQDIALKEATIQEQKSLVKNQSATIADLIATNDNLWRERQALTTEVEEVTFTFYYASLTKQRYGVDDLHEYLNRWGWIEESYKANVFDCSEMSAYLEWKLENEGYNTVIVAGNNPSGDGEHCWLLVEVSADRYMPVEGTTYSIVYWQNPYFDNYFSYDYEFETIHEALDFSPEEFDWWN